MRKTTLGTVLTIALAWTLYFLYLERSNFYAAHQANVLERSHLIKMMVPAILGIIITSLMLWNASKGKSFKSIKAFLKEDTMLTQEDERERLITSQVALKSYRLLSNLFWIALVASISFIDVKFLRMEHLVLIIALLVTVESMYFYWNFRKMISE